jgi:uncharacterized protein (TIGR03067 family)
MRRTTLLLFAATSLALTAGSARPDPVPDDAARLQGSWQIVAVEIDGKSLAMDKLRGARLNIQGKRYSFQLDKMRLEITHQLHPSRTPKAIDLKVVDGPEKNKVYHGIYTIDKDLYQICRTTTAGKDRPREFATRPNSGLMIVVWKRAKTTSTR